VNHSKPFFWFLAIVTSLAALAEDQGPRKPSAERGRPSVPALSPQQIFRRVATSVMVVESLDAKGTVIAFGSGVVIASGHVVTNRHVIKDGVRFRLEHEGRTWPANLIRVDPDYDLAELSAAGLPAPTVQVRGSATLNVGERVYAIGAPEGLELTISGGLISSVREFSGERIIQTSAAISPGSSGGGLFDSQGRLIGITTAFFKEGQNLNFALPAEWALAVHVWATGPKVREGNIVRNKQTGQNLRVTKVYSSGAIEGVPLGPSSHIVPAPSSPSSASLPGAEQDLPADQLAKLDGRAQVSDNEMDVAVYNGSSWSISSVTVRVVVPDQKVDRLYPLHWESPDIQIQVNRSLSPYGQAVEMSAELEGEADARKAKEIQLEKQGLNPARAETTEPGRKGTFSGALGSTSITAGEKWSWQIVSARGFPPR
jgi:S1-C subfamily serine protease